MIKVINVNKKLFYDNTRDSHLTELRVSTLMRKMPSESTLHPSPPLHALIFKNPKRSPRVFLKAIIFIGLSPFPIYQLFLPTHFLSFYFPLIPQEQFCNRRIIYKFFFPPLLLPLGCTLRKVWNFIVLLKLIFFYWKYYN